MTFPVLAGRHIRLSLLRGMAVNAGKSDAEKVTNLAFLQTSASLRTSEELCLPL